MRQGDWFLTYTGRQFYPIDPHPEDVCIEDISHALSMVCRFGGHVRTFYSVAQHSVIVSHLCPHSAFQALMHDATEAYVGDMVRPLKRQLSAYRLVEAGVWCAICGHFNIPVEMAPEIKAADNVALMTERRDLLTPTEHKWSLEEQYPPMDEVIVPLMPDEACALFMNRFEMLRGDHQ